MPADSPTSLATLTAFTVRLGRSLTTDEQARAQAALDDAATLIRAEARQPGAGWVDASNEPVPIPDLATLLCLNVARRFFSNPGNYTSETIGDYSWRGDSAGPQLTEDERRLAQSLSTTGRRPLWTLGMSDPDLLIAYTTDFVPDAAEGADPIAMFDQYDVGGSKFGT